MVYPSLFVVIVIAFAFGGFLFGLLFELAGAGDFGVGAVAEVVKEGRAVSFGPKADFAGVFEGVIFPDKGFLAVEGDYEVAILEIHPQGVPAAGSDFGKNAFLFGALAAYGVVDGDVVFEGVGAGDIIVVGIFAAPNDAAGLVFLAGDGLELHFDKAVLETGVVFDADGIGGFAGLFEDVRLAGSGVVGNDLPFGFAFAGFGGRPAGRWSAGFEVIEVDGVGEGDGSGEAGHNCEGKELFHVSFFMLTAFIGNSGHPFTHNGAPQWDRGARPSMRDNSRRSCRRSGRRRRRR